MKLLPIIEDAVVVPRNGGLITTSGQALHSDLLFDLFKVLNLFNTL
jgi:hypothetical protein